MCGRPGRTLRHPPVHSRDLLDSDGMAYGVGSVPAGPEVAAVLRRRRPGGKSVVAWLPFLKQHPSSGLVLTVPVLITVVTLAMAAVAIDDIRARRSPARVRADSQARATTKLARKDPAAAMNLTFLAGMAESGELDAPAYVKPVADLTSPAPIPSEGAEAGGSDGDLSLIGGGTAACDSQEQGSGLKAVQASGTLHGRLSVAGPGHGPALPRGPVRSSWEAGALKHFAGSCFRNARRAPPERFLSGRDGGLPTLGTHGVSRYMVAKPLGLHVSSALSVVV